MCKNIFLKTLSLALCALFICGIFTACGKTEQTLSGSSQASSETLSDVSYTESSYSVVKPRLSTAFAHYDGNKPLIEWSNVEGKKGVSARVVLKDKSGKTVLDQSGITTDIYAVSAALKKGEEYTLFVYYKIFDEEAGLISGVPEKGIKVKFLEQKGKYYFDGGISLDVLNNYLNRAMTYCHVRSDDISILKASIVDAGAKYIQRADCAWVPQAWDYSLQSGITEKLKKLHSMKTGALIKSAALMGYFSTLESASDVDEKIVSDISEYCECIGLAFQIKDDLLDLEGDAEVLGKAVGIDEKNGRVNALTFFTPDEAREECKRLSDTAKNIISEYENSEFLAALPEYLNSRNK